MESGEFLIMTLKELFAYEPKDFIDAYGKIQVYLKIGNKSYPAQIAYRKELHQETIYVISAGIIEEKE